MSETDRRVNAALPDFVQAHRQGLGVVMNRSIVLTKLSVGMACMHEGEGKSVAKQEGIQGSYDRRM